MNWKWLVALSWLWLLPPAVQAEEQAENLGIGRISFIQGEAQIQPAGTKEWQVASVNVPVRAGDRFWTPEDARMELQFQNGTVLRLDYKSTLDVLNLSETMMQFHLSMGHLLFRSSRRPTKTIQVDLPDSSLVVQDKALFRVDLTPEGEEFGLFQGAMQVATSANKTQIRTGEMLTLENGSAEVSPLKPEDEWERWNTQRDQGQLKAAAAAPYLPPELNAYADDLNSNGDWVNVPDYGYCWEPRIAVGIDWAPYRLGHWVFMDDDWVWVSFESWGWAPYHYGRWMWNADRWCWVPPLRGDIHWGPGYVGWVHSGRYVGWVPLAPGENFRRGVPFQGTFHNVPHAGAATLVERSVFASGRVVPAAVHENLFTSGKAQVGAPGIRPAGNVHFGPAVSANRLPATSVRSQDIQQLRQQHPQLKMVPAQAHQYRPGYNRTSGGQAMSRPAAASSGQVWGNRSVQRMWWVSPKSSSGGSNNPAKTQNYNTNSNGGGNVHGESSGGFRGDNGGGGGGEIHGGRR